jgi:hypothetical protein
MAKGDSSEDPPAVGTLRLTENFECSQKQVLKRHRDPDVNEDFEFDDEPLRRGDATDRLTLPFGPSASQGTPSEISNQSAPSGIPTKKRRREKKEQTEQMRQRNMRDRRRRHNQTSKQIFNFQTTNACQ